MECKCQRASKRTRGHAELIDTLWNVNAFLTNSHALFIMELIDTLWNVNFKKPPLIVINI